MGKKGGRRKMNRDQDQRKREDQSRQDQSEQGYYSEISRRDRPEMDQGSEMP